MKHKSIIIFLFFLISASDFVFSQTLEVGNKAPELKIEKWLKKGGFNSLQKGKVYVIDLWAVWCIPCVASMPHLSKLQVLYKNKGVEIIGITSLDPYGNTFEKVVQFVKKRDTLMNYNVAWVPASMNKDSLRGIFAHPWMQQIGSMSLPTAFVVDRNGYIAYIGDPHTIDVPLEEIVNKKYDMNVAVGNYRSGLKAAALLTKLDTALKTNNTLETIAISNKILNDFSYVNPKTYLKLAATIAESKTTNNELLDIALTAAKRTIVATQFESPGFYDLLATVYAAKGDYFMAAFAEKMAVSCSEGEMREKQIKKFNNYKSLVKE